MAQFCPKELSNNDLENVTGGGSLEDITYVVHYSYVEGGEILEYELPGTYHSIPGQRQARKDAIQWCEQNGYHFVSIAKKS